MTKLSWYRDGIRFECTECGGCCTGSPGYVWVSEQEIEKMAAFLKLSVSQFVHRYVRQVGDRYSLKELHPNFDCVFLEGKKCRIYPVRPKQCRTFPFWPEHLLSPETWKAAAAHCEGIREDAPLVCPIQPQDQSS